MFFLPSWPSTPTEQTLKVIQKAAIRDFTASWMFSHFAGMFSRAQGGKVRCKPGWLELLTSVRSWSTKY